MAKTYLEIQAQISKLQAEAKALREREVAEVVHRIKVAIEAYGLTAADLGLSVAAGKRTAGVGAKAPAGAVVAKYSDGAGNTWGGRGPRPAWLRAVLASGRSLEELAVNGKSSRATPGKAG